MNELGVFWTIVIGALIGFLVYLFAYIVFPNWCGRVTRAVGEAWYSEQRKHHRNMLSQSKDRSDYK